MGNQKKRSNAKIVEENFQELIKQLIAQTEHNHQILGGIDEKNTTVKVLSWKDKMSKKFLLIQQILGKRCHSL